MKGFKKNFDTWKKCFKAIGDYTDHMFEISALPDAELDPMYVSELIEGSGLLKIDLPCSSADPSATLKYTWCGLFVRCDGGLHVTLAYNGSDVEYSLLEYFANKTLNFVVFTLSLDDNSKIEIAIPVDSCGFDNIHITLTENKKIPSKLFGDLATQIRALVDDLKVCDGMELKKRLLSKKNQVIDFQTDANGIVPLKVISAKMLEYQMSGKMMY